MKYSLNYLITSELSKLCTIQEWEKLRFALLQSIKAQRKNQLSDFISGAYCTSQRAKAFSKKDNMPNQVPEVPKTQESQGINRCCVRL